MEDYFFLPEVYNLEHLNSMEDENI